MAHVSDHTDDLVILSRRPRHPDPLPDRATLGPVLARKGAVDHDASARIARVVVSEQAAFDEWGTHGAQEIVRDDPHVRDRFLADRRFRTIEHLKAGRRGEAGERQEADRATARDARCSVEPLEQSLEELGAVRSVVTRVRQGDPQRQRVRRIEPRIDGK